MFSLPEQVWGLGEGEDREGGTNVPSSRSTYKNNPHMVRHGGKILLRKVSCNSGRAGPLTVGSPGRRRRAEG